MVGRIFSTLIIILLPRFEGIKWKNPSNPAHKIYSVHSGKLVGHLKHFFKSRRIKNTGRGRRVGIKFGRWAEQCITTTTTLIHNSELTTPMIGGFRTLYDLIGRGIEEQKRQGLRRMWYREQKWWGMVFLTLIIILPLLIKVQFGMHKRINLTIQIFLRNLGWDILAISC